MAKPKRDPVRENRFHDEIIVDANGSEEQAMSWYYYLQAKIHFPFRATCTTVRTTSPLRKDESVEVRRMAPENSCPQDMLVMIRWQERNLAVPLSQLTPADPDDSTRQAIEDWHYWVAQGYCF